VPVKQREQKTYREPLGKSQIEPPANSQPDPARIDRVINHGSQCGAYQQIP
jgi:hypothetical protein